VPWNLLILPLLAGFVFIHQCDFFRFRSNRLESERLLLESAVFGVLFAAAARLVVVQVVGTPAGQALKGVLFVYAPFPYIGTALTALLLGFAFAHAANWVARKLGGPAWFRLYVADRFDDGLLKLLHNCMNSESEVFVSLSSRKVYVGYVVDVPNTPHDPHFVLALVLSGYRDERTLEFHETENYAARMPAEPTSDDAFLMLVDQRQVVSAYPFDKDRYEHEFAAKTRERRLAI
jgi:hypothetical protein